MRWWMRMVVAWMAGVSNASLWMLWWWMLWAAAAAAAVGCDCAADNGIGEAGAAAVAKALESGQCGLTSLNLGCEADSARALSVSFGVSGRCVRWWMRMVLAWMAGVSNASVWSL